MRIAVVSLFPPMIREALAHGVVGRALERGVLEVDCFDPRDYTTMCTARWMIAPTAAARGWC